MKYILNKRLNFDKNSTYSAGCGTISDPDEIATPTLSDIQFMWKKSFRISHFWCPGDCYPWKKMKVWIQRAPPSLGIRSTGPPYPNAATGTYLLENAQSEITLWVHILHLNCENCDQVFWVRSLNEWVPRVTFLSIILRYSSSLTYYFSKE